MIIPLLKCVFISISHHCEVLKTLTSHHQGTLLNQSCYIVVAVSIIRNKRNFPLQHYGWNFPLLEPKLLCNYTLTGCPTLTLLFMLLENPSIAMITNVKTESHHWSAPPPESTSLTCLSSSKTIYCFASQPYNLRGDSVTSLRYLSNAVTRMQMFNCIWNRFQTTKYSGIQFNLVRKQNQRWIKWAYLKEKFNRQW
jgi:hypothetical protein